MLGPIVPETLDELRADRAAQLRIAADIYTTLPADRQNAVRRIAAVDAEIARLEIQTMIQTDSALLDQKDR